MTTGREFSVITVWNFRPQLGYFLPFLFTCVARLCMLLCMWTWPSTDVSYILGEAWDKWAGLTPDSDVGRSDRGSGRFLNVQLQDANLQLEDIESRGLTFIIYTPLCASE